MRRSVRLIKENVIPLQLTPRHPFEIIFDGYAVEQVRAAQQLQRDKRVLRRKQLAQAVSDNSYLQAVRRGRGAA